MTDKHELLRILSVIKTVTAAGSVVLGLLTLKFATANFWFSAVPTALCGLGTVLSVDGFRGASSAEQELSSFVYKFSSKLPKSVVQRVLDQGLSATILWKGIFTGASFD